MTVEERVRELFLKNNYPECGTLSGKMLQERVVDIFQKLDFSLDTALIGIIILIRGLIENRLIQHHSQQGPGATAQKRCIL